MLPKLSLIFDGGLHWADGVCQTSSPGTKPMTDWIAIIQNMITTTLSVRVSAFFDAGQIYINGNVEPLYESFRYSAGVGVAWNSPVGPLKFSYGIPLNKQPGDKIQHFQLRNQGPS